MLPQFIDERENLLSKRFQQQDFISGNNRSYEF
uniref:Uncharacterized protein n=1 Tax=Arundo donax TaxID=35708 RepID=A0A0A9AIZ4_ARUDO